MPRKRVAIIGAGKVLQAHYDAINVHNDRAELVGIMDIDQQSVERACQAYDIVKGYTNTEQLLSETQPDLVHIITPPATHKDLIIQALNAGAWVYCEKPLCRSLAQFDEITTAEAQTGNYVSTVFQWRFGSAGQHLKQLIQTNAFGSPLVAICNTLWFRDQSYYDVSWRGNYETEFGGPTVTLGIHLMDFLLWLLGDWAEVQGMIGTLARNIEVEDVSLAQVRFKSGAMANIANSALSARQDSYLRLDFEQATLEMQSLYHYTNENWKISPNPTLNNEQILEKWTNLDENFVGSHTQQLSRILDAMDHNSPPPVQGNDARRIIEFLTSLYKSAFTGEIIKQGTINSDDPFYYSMNGVHPERNANGRQGQMP